LRKGWVLRAGKSAAHRDKNHPRRFSITSQYPVWGMVRKSPERVRAMAGKSLDHGKVHSKYRDVRPTDRDKITGETKKK